MRFEMTKSELRQIYLRKRAAILPGELADASNRIADRFFGSVDLADARFLHCFIPIAKFLEINTSLIYERVWREFPHVRTAAPRTDLVSGELEHAAFDAETKLSENSWGIREPADSVLLEPSEMDIVLVPLLCFDKGGHRVGYGKGFYDRFLARCRSDCLKIGLSCFPPIGRIDGISGHDVRLDRCITPDSVIIFEK